MLKEHVDSSVVEMRAERRMLLLIGTEFSRKTRGTFPDLSVWPVGSGDPAYLGDTDCDLGCVCVCARACMRVRICGEVKEGGVPSHSSTGNESQETGILSEE